MPFSTTGFTLSIIPKTKKQKNCYPFCGNSLIRAFAETLPNLAKKYKLHQALFVLLETSSQHQIRAL